MLHNSDKVLWYKPHKVQIQGICKGDHPCNSSSVFTPMTFPDNTSGLHKFAKFSICKSVYWYICTCISWPLALVTFSILSI